MNLKIIALFLFLVPLTFQAMAVEPTVMVQDEAISGIWQLKEAYVNSTRVADSSISSVSFVLNPELNIAYVVKGNQAIQYNLSYVSNSEVKLLDPKNNSVLFSYKVTTVTSSVLILNIKSVDPSNANVTHEQELRFVKIPVSNQQN